MNMSWLLFILFQVLLLELFGPTWLLFFYFHFNCLLVLSLGLRHYSTVLTCLLETLSSSVRKISMRLCSNWSLLCTCMSIYASKLQCVCTHTRPDLSISEGVANPFEWQGQMHSIHRMHVMGSLSLILLSQLPWLSKTKALPINTWHVKENVCTMLPKHQHSLSLREDILYHPKHVPEALRYTTFALDRGLVIMSATISP